MLSGLRQTRSSTAHPIIVGTRARNAQRSARWLTSSSRIFFLIYGAKRWRQNKHEQEQNWQIWRDHIFCMQPVKKKKKKRNKKKNSAEIPWLMRYMTDCWEVMSVHVNWNKSILLPLVTHAQFMAGGKTLWQTLSIISKSMSGSVVLLNYCTLPSCTRACSLSCKTKHKITDHWHQHPSVVLPPIHWCTKSTDSERTHSVRGTAHVGGALPG